MHHLGRFIAFAFVILIPPYIYLGFSLGRGEPLGWILLVIPFAMIMSLPVLVWSADRSREIWWRDLALHAAHLSMGIATYLFTFALVRDVLRWTAVTDWPAWVVFALTALALALGTLRAVTGPKIKRVKVPIKDLPEALRGFKIVQISDLHVGASIRAAYVARVVRMTNALKPDLVALTGDIADGDLTRMRPHVAALAGLEPKRRIYYVPGNHEYYWTVRAWLDEFKTLGCTVLLNEGEVFSRAGGDVWVGGITDPAAAGFGELEPDLARAFGDGARDCALKILLSHRPGFARRAGEVGFDLQLSGHTHGGQFFPWTVVVTFVHEFHQGLRRAGRAWIYVSPGTGTWGPLLRLGTTPELTLLTMEREA